MDKVTARGPRLLERVTMYVCEKNLCLFATTYHGLGNGEEVTGY
jgi:hypothetical protein